MIKFVYIYQHFREDLISADSIQTQIYIEIWFGIYKSLKVINRHFKIYNPPMNNNCTVNADCFSCGKELQTNQIDRNIVKHQIPICNKTTDMITLQKHFMCNPCAVAFQSVNKFVKKFKIRWFNKEFKLQQIINSTFIKMSHIDMSFSKQNRKSDVIQTSANNDFNGLQSQNKNDFNLNLNIPNDIYSAVINDSIESNCLHHLFWLPKPVQYLVHLTSSQKMRPQQRKQRVKKTLQILSFLYCVDQKDMKALATILHALFCYMEEEYLLKIVDRLLKVFLKNNISISILLVQEREEGSEIDKSLQERNSKKSVGFRPDKILQTIFSVLILSDFFKDSKLKKHILQITLLSVQQLTSSNEDIALYDLKNLQKVYEIYIKKNISDNASKLTPISENSWQELIQIKKQKNKLNLIVRTIKKEQEQNQQIMKEMENKYKKQKDEYVNKIVKLNNKIDDLENQIQTFKNQKFKFKQPQIDNQNPNVVKFKDSEEEVKSNPEIKHNDQHKKLTDLEGIACTTDMVPQSDTKCTESGDIKKHKSQVQVHNHASQSIDEQYLNYFRTILQVTDIVAFNNKVGKNSSSFPLSQIPNNVKELSQIIITEINNLQKRVLTLSLENKKLKEESSRILNILKRKQQKWLPLFHQKDEIISLYQKALICLENGIILSEEPLSGRIQIIVQKVSKVKFFKLEEEDYDNSMRDSTRGSFIEETPPDEKEFRSSQKSQKQSPEKQKIKSQKSSTAKKSQTTDSGTKIKKKTAKEKQKESECQIY